MKLENNKNHAKASSSKSVKTLFSLFYSLIVLTLKNVVHYLMTMLKRFYVYNDRI